MNAGPAEVGRSSTADDPALPLVHEATRELLYVGDSDDVVSVLADLVTKLGGRILPPGTTTTQELIDLSVDEKHPLFAAAADPSAQLRLQRHLPTVLADARASHRLIQLAQQADLDPLTGLANRLAATRIIPRLRTGDSVVIIDLDHFKQINDQHGHEAGDRVLMAFGELLREHSRVADQYLRIGGEEFLGVFHGQRLETVLTALERLRQEWAAATPYACTFSAGVAEVLDDDGPDAWRRADQQMYEAKRCGRDRICSSLAGR